MEHESKYRLMLEAMHDMVYICDAEKRLEYLNPALIRHIGRDATGEQCYRAIYNRDDICPWCPADPLSTGSNVQCETTCPADGRTFRISCTAIGGEGKSGSRMVMITDITERKQAELALQESETRYKRLVASVTDYIYSVKLENGKVVSTFHGPGCIAVTGYSTADYETDHDLWFKMVHVDDRKRVLEQARRLIAGELTQPFEHRIVHKTGKIRWVRNTAVTHRDDQGQVIAYDGLVSDITDRKQVEAQINEHARKLEIINRIIVSVNKAANLSIMLEEVLTASLELLQFHAGCIYLVDSVNRTADMRCVNGLPLEYISTMSRLELKDPLYKSLFADGDAVFLDNCHRTAPELVKRWNFACRAQIPLISKDKVIGLLCIMNPQPHMFSSAEKDLLQSIARQTGMALAKTRSEIALRESENRYRTITEQSLVGVQIIKDGRLVFVNDGWSEITGYTRQDVERWNDRDFMHIIHPEDRQFFMEHLQNKQNMPPSHGQAYDCRFFARSGATKWVALNSKFVDFADGRAIMAIVVDITDRKMAEQALASANRRLKSREEQLRAINQELFAANEQLKASGNDLMEANREKEMLLKEIHHRVKNNLQVVSSLLKLQMAHVEDETARQVISECQNRIKSIAIVHEKLYQSPNLADINIGDYIKILVKHLFRTYLIDPASISLNIAVADVSLGIDKAIPCSLIINELVSNSLKYAFVKTETGELSIALRATEDDQYILEVADNGCGLPADTDFRNTPTLGMQLVITFVEQLGGEITLDNTEGAHFTITFTDTKKNKNGKPTANSA